MCSHSATTKAPSCIPKCFSVHQKEQVRFLVAGTLQRLKWVQTSTGQGPTTWREAVDRLWIQKLTLSPNSDDWWHSPALRWGRRLQGMKWETGHDQKWKEKLSFLPHRGAEEHPKVFCPPKIPAMREMLQRIMFNQTASSYLEHWVWGPKTQLVWQRDLKSYLILINANISNNLKWLAIVKQCHLGLWLRLLDRSSYYKYLRKSLRNNTHTFKYSLTPRTNKSVMKGVVFGEPHSLPKSHQRWIYPWPFGLWITTSAWQNQNALLWSPSNC